MRKEDPGIEDIEETVGRYKKLVYGIALTQLKCVSDAEDVFQEVFLAYFKKNAEFADEEHKKAWLIKTSVNLCRRFNFSPWRLRTVPLSEAGEKQERLRCRTEEETRVFEELCRLKPKYKIPLYLHYFENMPTEKIAASLGIKDETVRKQLSRGRAMLKERLERDYFE